MAIDSSIIRQTVLGDMRVVIRKHETPGTGANEITTGADYVIAVFSQESETADKVCIATPNTTDHSTEGLGSYTLEAEADDTCYTLEFLSGG